jgi:2-oxoisovalerate dehydrogenase E1 component
MGRDIAEYGGAFKITEGLLKFSEKKSRNTPLCKSYCWISVGETWKALKSYGNAVCRFRNRWLTRLATTLPRYTPLGQNADVVIHATGAGVGAGHSFSKQRSMVHTCAGFSGLSISAKMQGFSNRCC